MITIKKTLMRKNLNRLWRHWKKWPYFLQKTIFAYVHSCWHYKLM